jgi:hypothetical protein
MEAAPLGDAGAADCACATPATAKHATTIDAGKIWIVLIAEKSSLEMRDCAMTAASVDLSGSLPLRWIN